MKDIDRANILDGLVIEIVFGKVEKSGVEKPSFRGGDIIISPPGTDRDKKAICWCTPHTNTSITVLIASDSKEKSFNFSF